MANGQNLWKPFEHRLYRDLRNGNLERRRFLMMVSGGADSMALLASLLAIRSALNSEIQVLHCHHGLTPDPVQMAYRDQAVEKVRQFCLDGKIPFHSRTRDSKSGNESEESLRRFRKQSASEVLQAIGFEFSVWAHHRDDFLETQVLRLIRGTGPKSLVEPMELQRGLEIRPFLQVSKVEILTYLKDKKIEWLEDPSNQNQDYLRNWLRQNWLPQLEEKCPGALDAFSRSLGLLLESNECTIPPEIWTDSGVDRSVYITLNEAQKKQVLAQYLRRCGKLEFSQNQILEVMRHLDKSLFDHRFKAAQVTWSITRHTIQLDSTN
jgi:tRNA(Ile)-lysidine synthetase-like protein